MTSLDLTPPRPIAAISGDDVARVELWAARQRAELSRLSLTLRSAQVKAEQAERDIPSDVVASDELLSVFDSMIDTAVQEADSAVEAARRDAAAIVAAEHERSANHLASLGLEPPAALGPEEWSSRAIPDVARAASAGALWQTIAAEARAAAPPPETEALGGAGPMSDLDPLAVPTESTMPEDERSAVDDPQPGGSFEAAWSEPELASEESSLPIDLTPGPERDQHDGNDDADFFDAFVVATGLGSSARPASTELIRGLPSRWSVPKRSARAAPSPTAAHAARPSVRHRVDDRELFDDAWVDTDRSRPARHTAPAGLGRPPPNDSADRAVRRARAAAVGTGVDDSERMVAFPSRWPDPERAAREFADPADPAAGHAEAPSKVDDAELFDVFWRGPEVVDMFWDSADSRRPIRDRLRRRAPQEQ